MRYPHFEANNAGIACGAHFLHFTT